MEHGGTYCAHRWRQQSKKGIEKHLTGALVQDWSSQHKRARKADIVYQKEELWAMNPQQRAAADAANSLERALDSLRDLVDELGQVGRDAFRHRAAIVEEGVKMGQWSMVSEIIELLEARENELDRQVERPESED